MSTVRRVVNWFGGHDGAVAAAIFLLSLALYVLTMAPSVVAGDGGEMQTVSAVLGVAHPTGYPLFTLLGWLFTHLPLGGDPAYRVTLLSAVAAAGTVACLYLLAPRAGGQAPGGAAGCRPGGRDAGDLAACHRRGCLHAGPLLHHPGPLDAAPVGPRQDAAYGSPRSSSASAWLTTSV